MNLAQKAQLATILLGFKEVLRQKIDQYLEDPQNKLKDDTSIVTMVDEFVSTFFKTELQKHFPEVTFYSEEDHGEFRFPVCVLDPIDGTKELAAGNGECAVSFGIYYSEDLKDKRNFSWIYNPFTALEVSSDQITSSISSPRNEKLCFVSRTEHEQGLFDTSSEYSIVPKGSIAYKLALLSVGGCDLVITKRDKNIWDILAGTHICALSGIAHDIKDFKISAKKLSGPITWSRN